MSVYDNLIIRLAQAKIPSPRLEARLLLAYVLQTDSNNSKLQNAELTQEQQDELAEILIRRIEKHEPMDKILGHKEFYKYDFIISQDVLSPRPDTEILLEAALELITFENKSVLDLGTGSGCILLSLLKEHKTLQGVGVDISAQALKIAQTNARKLDIEKQVSWVNKSWFDDDFLNCFKTPFDVIVSNPPYIPEQDILELDDEVKKYDPYQALSGGKDGLDSYRRIAEVTPDLLTVGGYILLECGIGQAKEVSDIFSKQGLSLCKVIKDLQGIDRCIILKK